MNEDEEMEVSGAKGKGERKEEKHGVKEKVCCILVYFKMVEASMTMGGEEESS